MTEQAPNIDVKPGERGRLIYDKTRRTIVKENLPCPICNGIEGCDHTVPERAEAARQNFINGGRANVTEDQIKHMVNRFLAWKLPENFNPDGGVTFEKIGNAGTPHEYRYQPSGTNLLDGVQADAMVRHMIDGMPK